MTAFIRILTYLVLALFPLGVLFRLTISPNVHIVPQDLAVGVLSIALASVYLANRKKNEFKTFFILQALFLLTGVISLLVNALIFRDINLVVSFLYVLRYCAYLSLLSVGPFFKSSKNIGNFVIVSGLVFLMAGFIQFVRFYNLKPLFHLGWDDHLYRLFSTMLDPNYAGVLYVLFFLLLMHIVYFSTLRDSYRQLLLAFFTVLAVYLTYSRTALVGLTAGIVSVGIIKKKVKVLLLAAVALILMLFIVSDTSVEGLNPFRTRSSIGRIISAKEALLIIEKSNYMGVGFNAFRYAQVRFDTRNEVGAAKSNSDAGTDNSFLFAMATTGIVGAIFFISSYLVLLGKLLREKQDIFFASMIIALLASSFFLNVLFYTPILTFLFIVFAVRRNFI